MCVCVVGGRGGCDSDPREEGTRAPPTPIGARSGGVLTPVSSRKQGMCSEVQEYEDGSIAALSQPHPAQIPSHHLFVKR